jgi:hypothetical protein
LSNVKGVVQLDIFDHQASMSDVPEVPILRIKVAFHESSRLNSRAAVWTGVAAVPSAIASALGVL